MNSRFEQAFKRLLIKKIDHEKSNIVAGMGLDTIEKYREQVGLIRGLLLVEQLWADAITEADKET